MYIYQTYIFILHVIDSNSLHNRHHKNQLRKRNQHHNELDSNLDRESNKVVNNDHTAPMNENYDWTFPMLDKSIVHNIGIFNFYE